MSNAVVVGSVVGGPQLSGEMEDKRQNLIKGTIGLAVLLAVSVISEFVCKVVIGNSVLAALQDDYKELQGESSLNFSGVFNMLWHLALTLSVPALGYYGATQMQKNAVNIFSIASVVCSCCGCCGVIALIVVACLLSGVSSAGTVFLERCDVAKACPLDGPRESVVDCLAASTWYDNYTRKTDYGVPLAKSLDCPPLWLNCTTRPEVSDPVVSKIDTAETIFRRLSSHQSTFAGWSQHAGSFTNAVALYQQVPSKLWPRFLPEGPIATRAVSKALQLSPRRLREDVLATDGGMAAMAGAGEEPPPPMPEDPAKSCVAETEFIQALGTMKQLLKDLGPTMQIWLIVLTILALVTTVAYGVNAYLGKTLSDVMPTFSNIQQMPVSQGYVVQP